MSRIAVTGATGYIGGRLVPRLLSQGHQVKVFTRDAQRLRDVPWHAEVEIIEGDLADLEAVSRLCYGAEVVYYLVHSMSGSRNFAEQEKNCASVMARAALQQGVGQVVYLSGLHPSGKLSEHLESRVAVGEILSASVNTLILQAGLVIGSGSASFEMIRHLSDVLPVMPAPRWVRNQVQPIAIRDALHYLVAAAQLQQPVHGAYDIGGPQAYSYAQLMQIYARVAGLREPAVWALPLLTPRLASHWVNLVTPLPRTLASALVASLQHDCVMQSRKIDGLIPPPEQGLCDYPRAVHLALEKINADAVETTWATAHPMGRAQKLHRYAQDHHHGHRAGAIQGSATARRRFAILRLPDALEAARTDGQAGRRRGLAPRPPLEQHPGLGRCGGLVASRGAGEGPVAALAGGNARARASLA